MKKLKLRFIDDLSLPITVVEDPYWEYQLRVTGSAGLWSILQSGIKEEYGGSSEAFLQDYYDVREKMIQELESSEKWKNVELARFNYIAPEVKSKDIYNEEWANKGKSFASIDLTKANVQAFAKVDPEIFGYKEGDEWKASNLWKFFVKKYTKTGTLTWYCLSSKYLRQVVFGKVNAKRQISIERSLVWRQGNALMSSCPSAIPIMAGADEIIFEVPNGRLEGIKKERDIDTKLKIYQLTSIPFETSSGNIIRIYKRETKSGEVDYKCIPRNYYAQIHNILEGLPEDPDGKDLAFYYEKEIAKFVGRLRMV